MDTEELGPRVFFGPGDVDQADRLPHDNAGQAEKANVVERKSGTSNLRWGVERRLEFVEFRLFWEGRINRADLMRAFGVSVNQASADLNRYLRLAPENMIYDKSAKSYVPGPAFSPLFLKLDSDGYLKQLRSVADGVVERENAWIRRFPVFAGVPSPARLVKPETLRFVLEALRRQESIEIRYQSLARPEPRWRWIAPHAIGFDGFRWHVRAFCETDRIFKDFLLARIIETRDARPGDCDPAQDCDWHEHVALEIGPNPGLSATQKQVIALDYGMQDERVTLRVRRAFLYYVLKRLGLDKDPRTLDPRDQHIVLRNPEMVEWRLPSADQRELA